MERENAASEKQVKAKGSREERFHLRDQADIRALMSSIHGRRFLWRLLEHCGVFGSVHHPSGSQVYYNAGKQDVGHFIMTGIIAADPNLFMNMQIEAKDYNHV